MFILLKTHKDKGVYNVNLSLQMSSLYLWAVFTFVVLATVMRHLMSDQVWFPVEGLGTLVTLVLPLFRMGQNVSLKTAGNREHDTWMSLKRCVSYHIAVRDIFMSWSVLATTHLWRSGKIWSHSLHSCRPWDMCKGLKSCGSWALRSTSPPMKTNKSLQ